jgi:carboxypeptidase PM20D1
LPACRSRHIAGLPYPVYNTSIPIASDVPLVLRARILYTSDMFTTLVVIGTPAALILILLIRTISLPRGIPVSTRADVPIPPDAESLIQRFCRAIRIPTVSYSDYGRNDQTRFSEFQDFLESEFARLLEQCEVHRFGCYGLAIRWPGSDADAKPLLYTAHYDVVPVEGQSWTHPPFDAVRSDGYVWGRGTLDTKNSLMALLEGASRSAALGFRPSRDIWFAFAGDEETSSLRGARTMAPWFRERGIRFEWVFDEGGIIARDMVPGVRGDAALVGVAEKGYADFLIECDGEGGHSSSPGRRTPLGRVARAVDRIERSRRPSSIPPTMRAFFRRTAPFMGFPMRLVMANLWLFSPLVKLILAGSDSTRAMIHSTVAPTMAGAAEKENVLPTRAWAVVNVRIAPGETAQQVRRRFIRSIRDERVRVTPLNPSDVRDPVLPPEGGGGGAFLRSVELAIGSRAAILGAFPYLMTGATDSTYYAPLADEVYRFVPMVLDSGELELIHSPDERISEENYFRMIDFYQQHIELSCRGQAAAGPALTEDRI